MRTQFLALILMSVLGVTAFADELTSIDFVSADGWRFFHDDNSVDGMTLDAALSASGFYDQWMLPDFDEADVLSVSWRDTGLPLVFGRRRTGEPSQDAVFLRKTFELDEPSIGALGMGVLAYDGFAVYLDGHEIFRHNCCEDATGVPTTGPLGLLDHALDTKFDRRTTYADLGDLALSAGQHTVAVAVHAARDQSLVTLSRFRLFQPGNEATWTAAGTSERWSNPNNWLFGVPSETDFAVFPLDDSTSVEIDSPVTVGGLRFVSDEATSFFHGEPIALAGSQSTARFDSLGTGGNHVASRVLLESDTDVVVEADLILAGGVEWCCFIHSHHPT